jgi:hypothetical protein
MIIQKFATVALQVLRAGGIPMLEVFLVAVREFAIAKKWDALDRFFDLTQRTIDREESGAQALIATIDAEVKAAARTLADAAARLSTGSG